MCTTGYYGLRCEYKYAQIRTNQLIEQDASVATSVHNKTNELLDNESTNDLEGKCEGLKIEIQARQHRC